MSLQFAHIRNEEEYRHSVDSTVSGTIAIDVPNKKFFEHVFLTHSNAVLLITGVSIKSEKDQYRKTIGRDIAKSKMVAIKFEFDSVSQIGTKHTYHFHTNDIKIGRKTYHLEVDFSTVAESDKVCLIGGYLDYA